MAARFWLLKSEPESFSIADLDAAPQQTTCWDGVRNYQARNFMRDQMQVGDRVLFYHSNADPPAVAGVAEVASAAYPDHTAWNPADKHYDPSSTRENPVWQMVDVRFVEAFARPLALELLRQVPGLEGMELLRKGSRLSVQPVSAEEFRIVLALAHGEIPLPESPAAPAKRQAARPVAKAQAARAAHKKVTAKSAGKLARPKPSGRAKPAKQKTPKKSSRKKSAAAPAKKAARTAPRKKK